MALFAAVFITSLLCLPYTLVCQEYEGLFLNSPDWWARALSQPFPVSEAISCFLVQFYRDPLFGALITAALVCVAFLLARGVFSSFGVPAEAISGAGAGVLWFFLARASSPKIAVAAVLILLVAWLLSLIIRAKAKARTFKADIPIASAAVLAAAALVVFSPSIRRTERFSRVKADALYGVWDDLLKTLPPSVAEADPELTPFALLALSAKGELGDKMFSYPVYGENDLDMVLYDGKDDYSTSLFFKACLYQFLGCYNEAIHNYYQWSTQNAQGTSFIVLRRLAELYCLQGNYTLMEKYCRILDKSLLHGAYVRHFRALAASGTPKEPDPAAVSASMPVITHDPVYNLILLESNGLGSVMSAERLLCTFILKKDTPRFKSAISVIAPSYKHIPRHFQEAMLFEGIPSMDIDPEIREEFSSFVVDSMELPWDQVVKRYKGTAFLYLASE